MLTYETFYCSGWMGDDCYEIYLKYNNTTIGCIYHYTDKIKGKYTPEIHFDKWLKYEKFKSEIPTINPKELAEQAILEYHLLS